METKSQTIVKNSNYQRIIDYMRDVDCFNLYNNIELTKMEDGYAEGRCILTNHSMNPNGKVHGGLLFALADYVGGFCIGNRNCVTQGANISYLRPADGEYLIAKATPIKVGKRVAVVDVCVYDDKEVLVSKSTNTYFFVGE